MVGGRKQHGWGGEGGPGDPRQRMVPAASQRLSAEGPAPQQPTVDSRLTADFWMNTRPMRRAICLRDRPTCGGGRGARRGHVVGARTHSPSPARRCAYGPAPAHTLAWRGGCEPHLSRGRQRLRQVFCGLYNLDDPFLVHRQLGRLRQRVRDGQLDEVLVAQPVVDCRGGGWAGGQRQRRGVGVGRVR